MANYSITFSCGHTVDKQLYGKQADRDRYINWAETQGECAACVSSDKAKRFEALEAEYDLPTLTGSEKQVAWARTVRAEKIEEIEKFFASVLPAVPAEKMVAFEEQAAVARQVLSGKLSASWWIDRRGETGRVLAAAAYKEAVK